MKKIENLLDFQYSGEFLKDFDIFLSDPYPERGCFIKIINLYLTLAIDECIRISNSQLLDLWLNRLERVVKFFIIVSENARDKSVTQHKSKIIANFLYIMNFLYIKYEKLEALRSQIIKTIINIQKFLILTVDVIN